MFFSAVRQSASAICKHISAPSQGSLLLQPLQAITAQRAELPVFRSSFPLVVYFTHGSVQIGEGNGTPLQYSCLENPMNRGAWWAAVHGVAKSRTRLSDFTFTSHFYALEKEMATHSSVLAWRIPGTGEPGGLPSVGSHRVGQDWSDLAAAAVCKCQWCLLNHPNLPLLLMSTRLFSASASLPFR